jgi:hypothetical protein
MACVKTFGIFLMSMSILLDFGGFVNPSDAIIQEAKAVVPTDRVTVAEGPGILLAYASSYIAILERIKRITVSGPASSSGRSFLGQGDVANNSRTNSIVAADETSSPSRPNSIASTRLVFAPDSFWYKPIPTDAPLHLNSANLVRDFLRQLKKYYGHASINPSAYSSPIYIVGAEIAAVPVIQWDCNKNGYWDAELARQWQAVPIPSYAQPANGTDSEMTIYQPSTDTMWEFWQARKLEGQWEACWGGRMLSVSKSDGIWPPHYGATATGLPFMGGQITVDELQRGEINHVMGIALVEMENSNIYSWPANRSDGDNPSNVPNRIPEGLRFRLDPSINVDALKLHPIAKIIAKAAQIYGFVVWDKSGAIGLRGESPKRFTVLGMPDPYPTLWSGTQSSNILAGFPGDKLQFMPMNYGRPLIEATAGW